MPLNLLPRIFGILKLNLLSPGKIPNILIPMSIINPPAINWISAFKLPEKLITDPIAPTMPPMTVYEITRPKL